MITPFEGAGILCGTGKDVGVRMTEAEVEVPRSYSVAQVRITLSVKLVPSYFCRERVTLETMLTGHKIVETDSLHIPSAR